MKEVVKKFVTVLKGTKYLLLKHKAGRFIHKGVPYFAQWESRNLVRDIMSKKIDAIDDPKWKNSGAKTKLDYLNWSWNGCGMACLKMILAYRKKRKIPLVKLGEECLKYGGYIKREKEYKNGDYLKSLDGLFYKPFIKCTREKYQLQSKIISKVVIGEIINNLANKKLIIASVHPYIRTPKVNPPNKGGHLVLVLGYDLDKKILYLHNPSGFDKTSQEYAQINFADFKKFIDNKGIVIS